MRSAPAGSCSGPSGRRSGVRLLAPALLLLAGAAVARASTGAEAGGAWSQAEVIAAFDAQLAAIAESDEFLAQSYQERATELQRRVRAAYKLMRSGWAPLWVDPERRAAVAQRRALVQRALSRTGRELALLRAEITAAARARTYLEEAREAAAAAVTAPAPAPGSLHRPVAPGTVVQRFGPYVHATGARLAQRGIELDSAAGAPVHAVAPGVVRWAGPVRGLGQAVIVAHDGFLSVIGRLADVTTQRGAQVARGDQLGLALGERVHLQVRLDVGGGGHPVDPEPLLE
jgi:murein DD-endopeptidase MepM/ murein hydrolase activator NlpD